MIPILGGFRMAVAVVCLAAGDTLAPASAPDGDRHTGLTIPHQDILKSCGHSTVAAEPGSPVLQEIVPSPSGAWNRSAEASTQPAAGVHGLWPASPGEASGQPESPETAPLKPPEGAGANNVTETARAFSRESWDVTRGERSVGWSMADLLPLLSVLGLIGLLAWVVKRCMPNRRLLTGSGVLEIVARTPLSGKQSLVLVKLGRQLLLLGVTADRLTALCTVDDADQVARLVGGAASERPGSMSQAFAQAFRQEAGAYSDRMVDADPAADASGQIRGLVEKIRRLKVGRSVA